MSDEYSHSVFYRRKDLSFNAFIEPFKPLSLYESATEAYRSDIFVKIAIVVRKFCNKFGRRPLCIVVGGEAARALERHIGSTKCKSPVIWGIDIDIDIDVPGILAK